MVDLDELDRLHAALPELEPQTIYVGDAEALAIICEAPWRRNEAMHDAATNAVTILRAYPALAAEVRALRAAFEETESAMHMRIRSGYDRTIADCWRAKLAERDAEIEALREVADAGLRLTSAQDACDEEATRPAQSRSSAPMVRMLNASADLRAALAKVPR